MATTSQPEYQLLVANFSRPYPSLITGADPDTQSYTRTRTGFVFRHIQTLGFSNDLVGPTSRPSASVITNTLNANFDPFSPNTAATADVTVSSDVFAGLSASLFVGDHELISNRDFTTGGGSSATAASIDAAINTLPGFSSTVAGSTVTVFGPLGQVGLRFEARYRGGELNFTFAYPAGSQEGVLGNVPPTSPIDPPSVLPAGLPNGVAP